jgi:hypothetical protein
MPRIDKTMLKGLPEAKGLHAERVIGDREEEVEVLHDVDLFDRYVTSVHTALSFRWAADHANGTLPVSAEEFLQYAYTAVRSRVARVRNERFHTRCDDRWCIPAQIAVPVNGIGRVLLEKRVVTLVPSWNKAHDKKLLDRDTWVSISQRMRAMTDYPGSKFVMMDALAGDRSGDEILMSLIPVRDEHGRITTLRSEYDIDPIAAATYLISGLSPRSLDGVVLPDHPLLMSPSYIRAAGIMQFLDYLAEVGT